MKTYGEVVVRLSKRMVDRYYGGANEYYTIPESDIVSFIYGVSTKDIDDDVTSNFKHTLSVNARKKK